MPLPCCAPAHTAGVFLSIIILPSTITNTDVNARNRRNVGLGSEARRTHSTRGCRRRTRNWGRGGARAVLR
ncbi:hypothetical protein EV421DRAFT_1813127 [Armillaria borealis]|uniref:Secreted protein n=1 Tax=Armillaria borealis TaxID=47425 RepID=A0AA39MP35_9AGAR|nr:hypothetical protein EV421DRAFT_1813127 [Armillaria borealis]